MQVGRVKQHHVTYLLLQKRINSEDFTAVGAFVGGKKRRKERGKRRGIIDSLEELLTLTYILADKLRCIYTVEHYCYSTLYRSIGEIYPGLSYCGYSFAVFTIGVDNFIVA